MPVTSTKSLTGHLLGGAGALGAIATLQALRTGDLPGTYNVDNLDPEVGLNVITGTLSGSTATAGIVNAFGFGGHSVALVVRLPRPQPAATAPAIARSPARAATAGAAAVHTGASARAAQLFRGVRVRMSAAVPAARPRRPAPSPAMPKVLSGAAAAGVVADAAVVSAEVASAAVCLRLPVSALAAMAVLISGSGGDERGNRVLGLGLAGGLGLIPVHHRSVGVGLRRRQRHRGAGGREPADGYRERLVLMLSKLMCLVRRPADGGCGLGDRGAVRL